MKTPVQRLIAAVAVALSPLALVAAAAAQPKQPTFQYGTKEEEAELTKVEKVEWKVAAQGGLIMTTGNSRVTTAAMGATASRKANRNKFSLEANAAYARSRIFLGVDDDAAGEPGNGTIEEEEIIEETQTTTRSWLVKGRYDRYLTNADALYGAAGIGADKPAGKELVGNGQAGYSRLLVQEKAHVFVAEVGYDFTYEDQIGGSGVSIHSLRGFAGYTGKVNENSGIEISGEILSNMNKLDTPAGEVDSFEDNRFLGKAAVTTTLFRDISFRAGFEARYDNAPAPRPPFALPYAPGFVPLAEELDTRLEATLIVSLL